MLFTKLWFHFSIASLLAFICLYPLLNPTTEDIKEEHKEIHTREIQYSDLLVCQEPNRIWNESIPPRYLGPDLTSSNRETLTLCPGDSFGDLNDTYLIMKDCDLEMYHKGKWIWSAIKPQSMKSEKIQPHPRRLCAGFLRPDGNLILKYGWKPLPNATSDEGRMHHLWSSKTDFGSLKTQLKIQGQQFQIFQTFQDGTQRLFYVSETQFRFQEYLEGSRRVGGSSLVKSHAENDTTILRMNEYLGDLDGLHLLLNVNCQLHLINQTGTIWYFAQYASLVRAVDCSLVIQEGKWISLSSLFYGSEKRTFLSLMILHPFKVLQSEFVLKDDRLTIIQTLEDGSKRTFESQASQTIPAQEENGLKMRKEPRKIAENPLVVTKNETPFIIETMDYIGDLNGLHLILQENCTLMLVNGQERIWQLFRHFANLCMECFVEPFSNKSSSFKCLHTYERNSLIHSGFLLAILSGEIKLENNYARIARYNEKENITDEYYAGPNTRGEWSLRISEHSLVLKARDYKVHFFDELSYRYIGDLNGIYLFMHTCHWTLYNQSQILWESTEKVKPEFEKSLNPNCEISFKKNGTLLTPYIQTFLFVHRDFTLLPLTEETEDLWSTKNTDPSNELLTSELAIEENWLWLINTFTDGTVQKFKALEGTHDFIAVKTSETLE